MKKLLIFSLLLIFMTSKVACQTVSDFTLPNVDGKTVSLSQFKNAKGFIIIFTCNHCPFAQFYPERLNALNKKYKALGVPVIAVNPMDTAVYAEENLESMKALAADRDFNFPYLLDASQKVAKDFKAKRTPQAFVIWKENGKWTVKYSGAIDDNGAEPEKVQTSFLEDAVKELLAGKKVSNPETASIGCKINYRK